jgi:hypothetical protein
MPTLLKQRSLWTLSKPTRFLRTQDVLSSAREGALLSPGEPDDGEIIVRALLIDEAEAIPKLAIRQKEAQPPALVAIAIFFQDLFDVHGVLP